MQHRFTRRITSTLLLMISSVGLASAQQASPTTDASTSIDSDVADQPTATNKADISLGNDETASEHPLKPVLKMAQEGLTRLTSEVRDYTCKIVRRERLGGKMQSYEFIRAKIRHAQPATDTRAAVPFSVYLKFLKPKKVSGREVLYLNGRNAGKMLVRNGGTRLSYVTTYLAPDSKLAMQENRYPITEIGMKRLIERLIEVIQEDLQHDECEVSFYNNADVGGRVCTRVVVEHPKRRDHFRYHRAIVFIDDERQIPLGYASYYWPQKSGGKPILLEEYIYADVELNQGLADSDFDRENPDYGFLREKREVQ